MSSKKKERVKEKEMAEMFKYAGDGRKRVRK